MVTCARARPSSLPADGIAAACGGRVKPGHVLGVLQSLQEFFIVLDGDDDRNGFAAARHDFGFSQCRSQDGEFSGLNCAELDYAAFGARASSMLVMCRMAHSRYFCA